MFFSNYWSMINSILLSIVFFLFDYCGFMCNFSKRQLFWAFVLIVRIISQPRPLFLRSFYSEKTCWGWGCLYNTIFTSIFVWKRMMGKCQCLSVCVCVCVCGRGDQTIFGIFLIGRGRGLEPKGDWRHLWKISLLGVQILHFVWFQRGNY